MPGRPLLYFLGWSVPVYRQIARFRTESFLKRAMQRRRGMHRVEAGRHFFDSLQFPGKEGIEILQPKKEGFPARRLWAVLLGPGAAPAGWRAGPAGVSLGLSRGMDALGSGRREPKWMDPLPKTEPDLIIFDCDGVLIDSEIISAETLIRLLKELGPAIDLRTVQENFLGRSFPTIAAFIRRMFDLDLPPNFEAEYRRVLLQDFAENLLPTPGIVEVLESLTLPVCVATSSSPERAAESLRITELDRFFPGRVFTASQVANGKPAPDLFLHAARTQGVAPHRCLVVEDSAPGIEAARAAGMPVLRYIGGSHFDGMRRALGAETGAPPLFDAWENFFERVAALKPAAGGSVRRSLA